MNVQTIAVAKAAAITPNSSKQTLQSLMAQKSIF